MNEEPVCPTIDCDRQRDHAGPHYDAARRAYWYVGGTYGYDQPPPDVVATPEESR